MMLRSLQRLVGFVIGRPAASPETWADFERLIAAIHKVAHEGAQVRWNEKIGGRQFDVTIRFRHGLYDYLTVIECRRRKGAVKADDVDSFVTKARDANADRAIFASTSPYQSGAVEVAKRHRINLIHVRENLDRLEAVLGEPEEVVHVRAIALIYSDGEHIELPEDSGALEYYAYNIRIGFSNVSQSLESILGFHLDRLPVRVKNHFEVIDLTLPDGAKILSPADDENVRLDEIATIQVQYGITDGRPIKSANHFQRFLLSPDIDLEDITTGEH